MKSNMCTFANLQVHRVINVLDQLLTAAGLLKDKPLEVEHENRRKLFQSHSSADLDLKPEQNKKRKECVCV